MNGKPIDRLTLIDVVPPEKPQGFTGTVEATTSDLSAPGAAAKAVDGKPDVIFHLAGVVSGEAETDFEKGYRVNLDGTRALLEAIRAAGLHAESGIHLVDRGLSARHFQILFPTNSISLRLHRTERRRRSASFCLPTTRGAVSSTVSASGCRRFACGPASRTRPHRASSPGSSGSRWPGRKPFCPSLKASATRMRARVPRSDS